MDRDRGGASQPARTVPREILCRRSVANAGVGCVCVIRVDCQTLLAARPSQQHTHDTPRTHLSVLLTAHAIDGHSRLYVFFVLLTVRCESCECGNIIIAPPAPFFSSPQRRVRDGEERDDGDVRAERAAPERHLLEAVLPQQLELGRLVPPSLGPHRQQHAGSGPGAVLPLAGVDSGLRRSQAAQRLADGARVPPLSARVGDEAAAVLREPVAQQRAQPPIDDHARDRRVSGLGEALHQGGAELLLRRLVLAQQV
mmetsp:Transcript_38187/g.123238  ORF Transcript_38187/g.123238 Transcript_38187/m.123238 type:complete len:255 (-) Transcript_38187:143-907(-)